jgi:transposase InsO family protein
MKRLQELSQRCAHRDESQRRRGFAGQRLERLLENATRSQVVQFSCWTAAQGWAQREIASVLSLNPRTLRQWQDDVRAQRLQVQALGRPVVRSPRADRQEVLEFLTEFGPAVGLPLLRTCFPALARAELADLLQRYRRVWRQRYHAAPRVLHWQAPGRVWAMDFTQPPAPIDGTYPYLLAVRDLASGQQLLWLPVPDQRVPTTVAALALLVALHGAPLVWKMDNGSAFGAVRTLRFLQTAGIVPLFSPPYVPKYNGAIEAANGSLKTRTERLAAAAGHPGYWSWDQVEAARLQANATSRPQGPAQPTPDEGWSERCPVSAEERSQFQATVDRQRLIAREQEGYSPTGELDERQERALDRQAIRRALEEHEYLLYSRRRIPLPIRTEKVAKIS